MGIIKLIFGRFLTLLTSREKTKIGTLINDRFDKSKNQTTLTLMHGKIVIPNKWTKTGYDNVSQQYFFDNEDKKMLAVAKNPVNNYPFYKPNETDKDFVIEFVKWEAEFLKQAGATVKTLLDKSENGFIIWQVKTGNIEQTKTIFLYGTKNRYAYNFGGISTTWWSDEKIIEFITQLYNNN